jgi:hypothetical protein
MAGVASQNYRVDLRVLPLASEFIIEFIQAREERRCRQKNQNFFTLNDAETSIDSAYRNGQKILQNYAKLLIKMETK